jgi:hypothetical protein
VTAVATLLDGVATRQGSQPTLADTYLTLDPKKEAGKGGHEQARCLAALANSSACALRE